MDCRRTANAGVLITLDGTTILLDGVNRPTAYYESTPDAEKENLYTCSPDIIAFTHGHIDHFDRNFAQTLYHKTLRSILGPEGLLKEGGICQPVQAGSVTVTPIPSRHIGKAGQGVAHVSYLIEGSQTILFTGDAAPQQFRDLQVDVLIAPYAYATTPSSWKLSAGIAKTMILLHLPPRDTDPAGLWDAVTQTTQAPGPKLSIPKIGEHIVL